MNFVGSPLCRIAQKQRRLWKGRVQSDMTERVANLL